MIFRRPYRDLIGRQLALFAEEEAQLLAAVHQAERAYDRAPRQEAEERFGEYSDLVETATEILADSRDYYASTLDNDAAEVYCASFNAAVRKRWPPFALEIENR